MSSQPEQSYGELLDGLVQLRFSDEDGSVKDINAAEMAEAIQGLVSFTSDMAKSGLFGDGAPPELRIRPPQEGSFILEAIVQWAGANPEGAVTAGMSAGGLLVQSIHMGFKKLRGDKVTDFEYLPNGDLKVKWSNGAADQVPEQVWKRLQAMKRPTRTALRNLMSPLSDDVDRLEVRDGNTDETTEEVLSTEPVVIADRADYRTANMDIDDTQEEIETFEAEAMLKSIDFRPGEKWHVQTSRGTRRATMDDNDFASRLDSGMALHKNDIFNVTIREVRTVKEGRTSREWSLINVVRKRRGGDDDNVEQTSATPPDSEQ